MLFLLFYFLKQWFNFIFQYSYHFEDNNYKFLCFSLSPLLYSSIFSIFLHKISYSVSCFLYVPPPLFFGFLFKLVTLLLKGFLKYPVMIFSSVLLKWGTRKSIQGLSFTVGRPLVRAFKEHSWPFEGKHSNSQDIRLFFLGWLFCQQ